MTTLMVGSAPLVCGDSPCATPIEDEAYFALVRHCRGTSLHAAVLGSCSCGNPGCSAVEARTPAPHGRMPLAVVASSVVEHFHGRIAQDAVVTDMTALDSLTRSIPLPAFDTPFINKTIMAAYLDISTRTVDRLMAAGDLSFTRVRGQVRFSSLDVAMFLANSRVAEGGKT